MTKQIPLTQGQFAIVDDDDYESVSQFRWYAHRERGRFYAGRSVLKDGKKKNIGLHRVVMNAPDNLQVDHINLNGLDCRKGNLRICTISQNKANREKQRNNTSGYKGVTWHKGVRKWRAQIGKTVIGYYESIEDAARAYDETAVKRFGEFARTNLRR